MNIEIEVARTVDEALERLAAEGPELRPVAGATDALLKIEAGRLQARRLLSIADLEELAFVREEPTHLEVGALTLVADLAGCAAFAGQYPCAVRASREFASPQIRNRATLGGNIANASPAADMVPPLIALGAEVRLRSRSGERVLPLESVFVGPGKTALRPDELIVALKVPRRRSAFQAFAKFGNRGANVIAIVNAAFCFELDGGRIREARVAYGCCAPVPLRARKVEAWLTGRALDAKLLAEAAEVVRSDVAPIDDVRGSRRYKELLAVNATEDALQTLLEQGRQAA